MNSSQDYPLGGTLETYDIEREKDLVEEKEKCITCGIEDVTCAMYSTEIGYYCECCAEKFGVK